MFMNCSKCGASVSPTSGGVYTCSICGHTGNTLTDNTILDINTYAKDKQNLLTGWVCPKCGAVMAPHQNYCINCTKINFNCTFVQRGVL